MISSQSCEGTTPRLFGVEENDHRDGMMALVSSACLARVCLDSDCLDVLSGIAVTANSRVYPNGPLTVRQGARLVVVASGCPVLEDALR